MTLAAYLGWSFLSGRWEITWLVWPIAGVLFVPFESLMKLVCDKNK